LHGDKFAEQNSEQAENKQMVSNRESEVEHGSDDAFFDTPRQFCDPIPLLQSSDAQPARSFNMHRVSQRPLLSPALLCGLWATTPAQADGLSAAQLLREGGCGGTARPARLLRHNALLDRAAESWAAGSTLRTAAERSAYEAEATAGLHVSGPESSMVQQLERADCRTITNPGMRDVGVYHRGMETWLVLGAPYVVPPSSGAPMLARRALDLVNEVRTRGTHCGERSFGPAPPVTLSGTLAGVAFKHASDMAQHNYFEHEDLTGRSPADRVRAVGYREKLVGENIAYGPESAEEVVQGWLDSTGHCENIMDPRFAEMGIAFAPGHSAKRGLYWVQLLAEPAA
jgi:uncharacterized protein YkwD